MPATPFNPRATPATEHARFVQRRTGQALLGFAAMLGIFVVYSVLENLLADLNAARSWSSVVLLAINGTVVAAGAWSCLTGTRSESFVAWTDNLSVLVTALLLSLACRNIPIGFRPELTLLLGLMVCSLGRAILIPSTSLRTGLLCLALAVPLAAVTWETYIGYVPPPGYPNLSSGVVTIFIMLWWTLVSVLATATSHVIYGLRREVDRIRKLGQYTLEEEIGAGGMGTVHRARHAMLRRPTAIKLLSNASEVQVERFEREVQLTAQLTHPNTIVIYDYGLTPHGVFYYAMEYLQGVTLQQLVEEQGPQPAARVIHLLRQVCGALTEAHDAGLIHRDIKPANIFLCHRGGQPDVVKVLDFGLVKSVNDDTDSSLTKDSTILGTPLYMSPEAITKPEQVDARSDLYAVAAVGYFLLAGVPVFEGDSVVEVCSHHLHSVPTPPSQRGDATIPEDLEALLISSLAKDPSERPRSAAQLNEQLARCEATSR